MMSRIRTAIRILPARSIWVPPTSTVLPWPILSSIAAASHGVAMSRLIGPAPSRHPQRPETAGEDHRERCDGNGNALYPQRFAADPAPCRPRPRRQTGEKRNWNATTAAARAMAGRFIVLVPASVPVPVLGVGVLI